MEADKDKLKIAEEQFDKVFSDPNLISGIHNYCDRWCERCTHTSRCAVFKMEAEMNVSSQEFDLNNQKFWDNIHTMFQLAGKMLDEMMKERGIDPSEAPEPRLISKPHDNQAVDISKEYSMSVNDWLNIHRDTLIQRNEILLNISEEKSYALAEAIEIIQYYFILVSSKTYRSFLPREFDECNYDALGSAKITLIIIDRSSAAWVRVLELLPEFEDDILGFLKYLSIVKRLILEHYPNAMEFVRPGFDE